MQTIIMTVGTSLRTNSDRELDATKRRPWVNKPEKFAKENLFHDLKEPLDWMKASDLKDISAETNTLSRLDLSVKDRILLLHSATPSGKECALILQVFFKQHLAQEHVDIEPIPEINYDIEESGSALSTMADLLRQRILQAQEQGLVTLAATGGFKAQTMVMGLVGNALSVPVCYVHEAYKTLIYLPYINTTGRAEINKPLNYNPHLPASGRPRDQVIQLQAEKQGHHRPKSWGRVKKLLRDLSWIDLVHFDKNAFNAPLNGIKGAPRNLDDGRKAIWLHLYESEDTKLAVVIETTGFTPEHMQTMTTELREKLGRIF